MKKTKFSGCECISCVCLAVTCSLLQGAQGSLFWCSRQFAAKRKTHKCASANITTANKLGLAGDFKLSNCEEREMGEGVESEYAVKSLASVVSVSDNASVWSDEQKLKTTLHDREHVCFNCNCPLKCLLRLLTTWMFPQGMASASSHLFW